MLDREKNEIVIRELDDDIYATESEFKEELVPQQPTPELFTEEPELIEDFDFEDLDLGDDDLNLDDEL